LKGKQENPWAPLVSGIRANDPAAVRKFHILMAGAVRDYLASRLNRNNVERDADAVLDKVCRSIREGANVELLMVYVWQTARAYVALLLRDAAKYSGTKATLQVFARMRPRQREILTRGYLDAQAPERICAEMHLTARQYDALKDRAKTSFAKIGRAMLKPGLTPAQA
jgi:hypothetical protein